MNDRLLTKYEVMDTLKISRKHFEKLVKEKELPMIQITPYKRYVRISHLNRYIDERTINKPQEITQESETDNFKWKNIWGKWWGFGGTILINYCTSSPSLKRISSVMFPDSS